MTSSLRVVDLRVEHLVEPFIDAPRPRLSWCLQSARNGARQAAYQVRVAGLWDSGRVASDASTLVPYDGPPLASRQRVEWSVQVWDDDGETAESSSATWEMGLLDSADWTAQWIAAPGTPEPQAVTYVRSTLTIEAPVTKARAYATALGLYELRCNGQRVGADLLTPGWTDYAQRIQYHVLDLTDVLVEGDNEIVAVLGDGWYAGYVGFTGERELYGDTPQFLAQIDVDTEAGAVRHVTDASWTAGRGPVRSSDMLMGETQDFTPTNNVWTPVRVTAGTPAPRSISPAPPVRVLDELQPVSVTRTGPLTHRIDVGQNITGWLRLRLSGESAARVEVRHAEVTNADGSLHLANLRGAKATDCYILDGIGPRVCEPAFTFHGFRYADVSGYADDLSVDDVAAVVIGSAVEPIGSFACSDDRVNQLVSNIIWSARGNFVDVPTDCPQRDERLGWMGDAQVFAPTACALFDVAAFFTKWLRDVTDAQSDAGGFSNVAPRVIDLKDGVPGWGDAGVIVPWVIAARYADREMLASSFDSMRKWVRFIHDDNPTLLWLEKRSHDLGDWLNIDAETDKDLVATAFFAWSTRLTARAAHVLGYTEDAAELDALADAITTVFRDAFVSGDGAVKSGTQTAYALSLQFGLIPVEQVDATVAHLVADVEQRGDHISTGFLGVAHILPALSAGGRHDVALRLLHQDTFPSWLYEVDNGATTIWERWDGWTAERGLQDPAMNSFNHYAFGAVGEWLMQTVAGISLVEFDPGRVVIAPQLDPSLSWVRAHTRTPHGTVAVAWQRDDAGAVTLDVEVPVGTAATVFIPGVTEPVELGSGHHQLIGTHS